MLSPASYKPRALIQIDNNTLVGWDTNQKGATETGHASKVKGPAANISLNHNPTKSACKYMLGIIVNNILEK